MRRVSWLGALLRVPAPPGVRASVYAMPRPRAPHTRSGARPPVGQRPICPRFACAELLRETDSWGTVAKEGENPRLRLGELPATYVDQTKASPAVVIQEGVPR
jgi:hypothetical protein